METSPKSCQSQWWKAALSHEDARAVLLANSMRQVSTEVRVPVTEFTE